MQVANQQEFAFVYQDLKLQLKQIPSLPLLLKSIEKTTKKLECLNLYSLVDRREFDFQLFENQTFEELRLLLQDVTQLRQKVAEGSINMQALLELQHRMDTIKQQKMQAFDKLNKTDQTLTAEIETLADSLHLNNGPNVQNEIKEVQEDEQDVVEEHSHHAASHQDRIDSLKKEIDELNGKIVKINRGKGKWFDGDHNDFVKLYTRLGGDAKKLVEEGVKVLGMKNIEIMDHLEVYQSYLQLQKQKKLASEEFKSIKSFQKQSRHEIQIQGKMIKQQKERIRQRLKQEQNLTKKMQVDQFRRKKAEQHEKLIQQIEKDQNMEKKVKRVSVQKKKEIQERNKRMLLQKQEEFKNRNNSAGGPNSSKNKPKIPTPPSQLPDAKLTRIPKPVPQIRPQLKKQ